MLPADGGYVLEVSAGAGAGGSYAFRLLETSLTDLTLGTAHVGAITSSGQAQLFRVNVPSGQQLRIHLDDSIANNRNELYVKFGAPPMRDDFQYRASEPSADQQLVVPGAAPGAWYILLYSEAALFPSTFTLTATADDLFLTRVTPDRGGTKADLVLTLTGAGFDYTTTVELVNSLGVAFAAQPLAIVDRSADANDSELHRRKRSDRNLFRSRSPRHRGHGRSAEAFQVLDGRRRAWRRT